MKNLRHSGRSNVLYRLARGLATMRADSSATKFPTDRMPMGQLEYMVGFFDSDTLPQVQAYVVGSIVHFNSMCYYMFYC